MTPHRPGPIGLYRWSVWALPRPALAVVVIVDLLAVASLAVAAITGTGPPHDGWVWTVVALVAAGLIGTEASLRVERLRRRTDQCPRIDLSSVWTLAAAVLLPGLLAAGVAVALYVHLYVRLWRHDGVPPHRFLFSLATVVLAVLAAAGLVHDLDGLGPFPRGAGLVAVLIASLAYAALNMLLIAVVIVLSDGEPTFGRFLTVVAHGDEAVLELATLSMGVLVAGAMAAFGPVYAVLVLPPLIVLHRTVLVRQLEEAASTDGKTGLLNSAAWHVQAGREVRRAERVNAEASVLVLDLDHFKLVNDRYGHLVGDQVLAAVAGVVREEVRDEDVVGRFGGEEFVVLLRGIDGDDGRAAASAVAERIRLRVAGLRVNVAGAHTVVVVDDLTVSIGGATFPGDGDDLGELLEAADTAMYEAKRAGRNRIRMGVATRPRTQRT